MYYKETFIVDTCCLTSYVRNLVTSYIVMMLTVDFLNIDAQTRRRVYSHDPCPLRRCYPDLNKCTRVQLLALLESFLEHGEEWG
jgi:hypothetical protein